MKTNRMKTTRMKTTRMKTTNINTYRFTQDRIDPKAGSRHKFIRRIAAAACIAITIADLTACGSDKQDGITIIGGADGPTTIFLASKTKVDKTLSWLYEKGGINVIWGDKISSLDTHGGFHGDGSSLNVYQFTDSSMQPEMEESDLWKPLPLSENTSNLITNTINDKCAEDIPEITNGYYFFYDRHDDAEDRHDDAQGNPYDDSQLWSRSSVNCTLAIYDADTDILYVYTLDT